MCLIRETLESLTLCNNFNENPLIYKNVIVVKNGLNPKRGCENAQILVRKN